MTYEEAKKLRKGDIIARKANPSERYIVVDTERYHLGGYNLAILVSPVQPQRLEYKLYIVNPEFYDLVIDSTDMKIMKQATEEEVFSLLV